MQLDTLGMGGGGYAIAAAVSKEQRQSRIAAQTESVVLASEGAGEFVGGYWSVVHLLLSVRLFKILKCFFLMFSIELSVGDFA